MKKLFFSISAALLVATTFCIPSSYADDPAFDKGSNTIGLSLGAGVNYGYYSGALAPSMAFTYDHGFFPEVGPGTIGIGGIVAYKSGHYRYGYGDYEYKWSSIIVAARGTYHLTLLKDKNNHFDPYAGVVLGVRINSYSDTYDDYYYSNYHSHYYKEDASANAVRGVFIGAKYNFTKFFGLFAELGSDVSVISGGVNFNF